MKRKTYPLQITVPVEWVEKIDELARREGRSRSNWLVMKLAEITGEDLPESYAPRAPRIKAGDLRTIQDQRDRLAGSLLNDSAKKYGPKKVAYLKKGVTAAKEAATKGKKPKK